MNEFAKHNRKRVFKRPRRTSAIAIRLILFVTTLMLLAFSVSAQTAPPAPTPDPIAQPQKKEQVELPIDMKTQLRADEIYPGDEIDLTVTFSSEKPFAADVLGSLPLGKFDLKTRDTEREQVDDRYIVRHHFKLLRFEPGVYEIPRILFSLTQNGEQQERKSDLVRVTVKSLLEEEAMKIAQQQAKNQKAATPAGQAPSPGNAKIVDPNQQQPVGPTFNMPNAGNGKLPPTAQPQGPMGAPGNGGQAPQQQQIKLGPRDIKGVLPVIHEDYSLLYVLGGLLGLILLAVAVWLYLRFRKPKEIEVAPVIVDTRPAHEIALERLSDLQARQLVAKRQLKDYHLELSEILRGYFERRYNIQDALSMTSEEIGDTLAKLYMRDLSEEVVRELLQNCDLVLFAKDEPSDERCHERLETARTIVTRTKEVTHGIQ